MTPTKTIDLDALQLKTGSHRAPSNGLVDACVMEAVAYVAGEPWSELDELRTAKESAERRIIRERARADQAEADAQHERNRVRGYQGALGKAKKRVAAGMCPAAGCKRHFANVAAHIQRMHPGLAAEPVVVK